jgi:hypothetical protein
MATFWLKGSGSLNWAAFTKVSYTKMRVLALTGAASYIDRTVDLEEGRNIWRDLQSKGWTAKSDQEAKAADMTAYRLQLLIHD